MSAIEETLSRISLMSGVEGYVIVDGKGTILRQSKSFTAAEAGMYASEMLKLTQQARHVVRDLDPRNDLEVFRLRGRDREVLASPGPGDAFLVVIVQKWSPAPTDDYANPAAASTTASGVGGVGGAGGLAAGLGK